MLIREKTNNEQIPSLTEAKKIRTVFIPTYCMYISQEKRLRSIFDTNWAGQCDSQGNYMVIFKDHITKENYCLSKDDWFAYKETGHEVLYPTYINGEKVRPMTMDEENLWNRDELSLNVDVWGNVEHLDNGKHWVDADVLSLSIRETD